MREHPALLIEAGCFHLLRQRLTSTSRHARAGHARGVIFRWYSNTLQEAISALEQCGRVRQHQFGVASLGCFRLLCWGQEAPAPKV